MRSLFENRTNMIDLIIDVCEKNPAVIALMPAFMVFFGTLKSIRDKIHDINQVYMKIIKGITEAKRLSKENCVLYANKFSKAMKSYAHKIGDTEMEAAVSIPKSDLRKMRDGNFGDVVKMIYVLASPLMTELADYGIIAADLVAFDLAIKDYVAKIPEPKEAIQARKTSISLLRTQLALARDLLKNEMDPLVDVLSDVYVEFKTKWKNGRSIYDNRGSRRVIPAFVPGFGIVFGIIINSFDGGFIEDAIITIVELGLSTTSDDEGFYYFENVPAGVYTLKITASTYLDVTPVKITVNGDGEVSLDVTMNADAS